MVLVRWWCGGSRVMVRWKWGGGWYFDQTGIWSPGLRSGDCWWGNNGDNGQIMARLCDKQLSGHHVRPPAMLPFLPTLVPIIIKKTFVFGHFLHRGITLSHQQVDTKTSWHSKFESQTLPHWNTKCILILKHLTTFPNTNRQSLKSPSKKWNRYFCC